MQTKFNSLVQVCKPAIAAVAMLAITGCDRQPASSPLDLTKVSRMACNSDGTLPSAWDVAGLVISLNEPDNATLLMAEQSFTFAGNYRATDTTLTMSFHGGVDGVGNVSQLRTPSVKTIESFRMLGQDEDGWPHIETSGFKLKCIVERRKPAAVAVTVERSAAVPGGHAPIDPINEEFIATVLPPPATVAEPEPEPELEARTVLEPAPVATSSHPHPTAVTAAASTHTDKESNNETSSNGEIQNGVERHVALYSPLLKINVVKGGQPIQINSIAKLRNISQEAVSEVREELIVFDLEGKQFRSGSTAMVGSVGERYENSFTLTLPQDAQRGNYTLKMNLYLNRALVSTRDLRVRIE